MTWTCDVCGKKFGVGEWTCTDGVVNHVIAEKTYRTLDATPDSGRPADGSLMPIMRGQTTVCNIPPAKKVTQDGEIRMIGEGSVVFFNGRYSTKDPEQQYWLDKKPGYNATEDQWKSKWLTKDELLAEKELQLRAAAQRLENERNDLLSQVKSAKAKATA